MTENPDNILKKEDFKTGRKLAAFLGEDINIINEALKHFYKTRKKIQYNGHPAPMVITTDNKAFRLHPAGLSTYIQYLNSKGEK